MKRTNLLIAAVLMFSFLMIQSTAQEFNGAWSCAYATIDDNPNATGYNTISVGVVSEDEFAALVNRGSADSYYLVGYRNADSTSGRLGNYEYSPQQFRSLWISGFDQIEMFDAYDLAVGSDGKLYVANNDPANNILVFELTADSVGTTDLRVPTSSDLGTENDVLRAIDLDGQDRVYFARYDTTADQSSVLIIDSPTNEAAWLDAAHPIPTFMQEIILPDAGEARGVTVNSDGTSLYVSNYDSKRIHRYVGDPVAGYSLDNNFDFLLTDTAYYSLTGDTLVPGPWGMNYMNDKNILFVACDVNFQLGAGYEYARMYAVHPETGAILDTIDVAQWNFDVTGSYNGRPSQIGIASGYASTYYLDIDENYNVYSQSYYGWTVEKWVYSESLPVITGVEEIPNVTPEEFSLNQNYPNPFNPTTTIEFSVVEPSNVTLSIYSITGELITTLIDGKEFNTGAYKAAFDAKGLASGTYIYTIKSGTQTISKKMTLLK